MTKRGLAITKTSGFTIIETVIIIFVFVMVSLMSFTFLLTTLTGNSKIEAMKEARQNGSFALSAMERLIISSKKVVCNDSQSITVTVLDGTSTYIGCVGERLASGSGDLRGYLTNEEVKVLNCNFTCTEIPGVPKTVGLGFSVSQKAVTTRTSETASVSFSSKVIVRNEKD